LAPSWASGRKRALAKASFMSSHLSGRS